jgi:hypothetical protein
VQFGEPFVGQFRSKLRREPPNGQAGYSLGNAVKSCPNLFTYQVADPRTDYGGECDGW